mmetsp:Transcript_67906/g.196585  ORF Transcript_67906/g.196585 Transcript_67906/m.196585 type:complete len:350 (+) Transcript_67906:847-1896(+)
MLQRILALLPCGLELELKLLLRGLEIHDPLRGGVELGPRGAHLRREGQGLRVLGLPRALGLLEALGEAVDVPLPRRGLGVEVRQRRRGLFHVLAHFCDGGVGIAQARSVDLEIVRRLSVRPLHLGRLGLGRLQLRLGLVQLGCQLSDLGDSLFQLCRRADQLFRGPVDGGAELSDVVLRGQQFCLHHLHVLLQALRLRVRQLDLRTQDIALPGGVVRFRGGLRHGRPGRLQLPSGVIQLVRQGSPRRLGSVELILQVREFRRGLRDGPSQSGNLVGFVLQLALSELHVLLQAGGDLGGALELDLERLQSGLLDPQQRLQLFRLRLARLQRGLRPVQLAPQLLRIRLGFL